MQLCTFRQQEKAEGDIEREREGGAEGDRPKDPEADRKALKISFTVQTGVIVGAL